MGVFGRLWGGIEPRLQKWGTVVAPYGNQWFKPWISRDNEDIRDFVVDANLAHIQQDPIRARSFVHVAVALIVVLIAWAALMQIDEITRGDGKVVPSRQLQVVQSQDGGIVSAILVKEGEVVNAGQILIQVDETRFVSSFKESRATYLALQAKVARLVALARGTEFKPPDVVAGEAPALVEQEKRLYLAKLQELDANLSIARQQLAQREQELNEIHARRVQAIASYDLASRELELTRPLLKSGAVSDVDLLRLEREVARLRGERDTAGAQIARLQAAIQEARRKIEEVEFGFRNQAHNELAEASAKLSSISEGSVALSDKVRQTAIKSPVHGTVKRILFNTVGGVIQPGKEVLEIVPLEEALLLEARVQPRDIAFLRPGQPARVRLTAYDFSIYGSLEGTLEHISADSVTDEKGNSYYVVRVRTAKPSFGPNLPIIPGMVAEVDILTGKKSVLSYLLKPILRAKAYALSER